MKVTFIIRTTIYNKKDDPANIEYGSLVMSDVNFISDDYYRCVHLLDRIYSANIDATHQFTLSNINTAAFTHTVQTEFEIMLEDDYSVMPIAYYQKFLSELVVPITIPGIYIDSKEIFETMYMNGLDALQERRKS